MMDNWVERRWLREENLRKGAPAVWQDAATAIDNACIALKKRYSDVADITHEPKNGHRVLIKVRRKTIPSDISNHMPEIAIQIIFESGIRIAVIEGYDKTPRHFQIEADETHAFLKYGGREISADEFSKFVLEDVVFNVHAV